VKNLCFVYSLEHHPPLLQFAAWFAEAVVDSDFSFLDVSPNHVSFIFHLSLQNELAEFWHTLG